MNVIQCPSCSQKYRVPPEQLGKQVQCQACKQTFVATDVQASLIPPEFDESIPASKPTATFKPAEDRTTISRETELRLEAQQLAKKAPRGATSAQAAIIIILLSFLVVIPIATNRSSPQAKWEYKISSPIDSSLDRELKELGADGWELVTARRATSDYGTASYEMIFKRVVR